MRITKVAELYERKPITQKYTFEVLCDFITDKAKRMFAKYENLSKEKKGVKDEKSVYYQRKLDALEQELRQTKFTATFAERVIDQIVPRLLDLIDQPLGEKEKFDFAFEVLQTCENDFRTCKKSNVILKEINSELQKQVEVHRNELGRNNETSKFLKQS